MTTSMPFTSEFPIRPDLALACESEWGRLGRPGAWWSGRQRIAIAMAARDSLGCDLCVRRRRAVTPSAADGDHTGAGTDLDPVVIDAAHKVRTDAARITHRWVDEVLTTMPTPAYVEMIGIVVTEVFIDTLALALGAQVPAWPPIIDGAPTNEAPPVALVHSAWIPTVPPDRAEGAVAEIYARSSYDTVSNVIRSLSLVPPELVGQGVRGAATYRSEHLRLSRAQTELVATATSAANDCFY